MLKSRQSYTYHHFPVPSFLIIEGFGYARFKTKEELKQDFKYFLKKLLYKFKKPVISNNFYYSTKSLSSFDYHIRDKGAIVDQEGNIHTTASSYKDYLKKNDLVIKDWSDGSNKPKQQLSDRNEIAKIVNKYI